MGQHASLLRRAQNWTGDFPPVPDDIDFTDPRVVQMNEFLLPFGWDNAGYVLGKYPSGIIDIVPGPYYNDLYAADDEKLHLMQYYADIPDEYKDDQEVLDAIGENRCKLLEHETKLFEPLGVPPVRITDAGTTNIHTFTYDFYQLLAGAMRTYTCAVVDPIIIIVTEGMWENPNIEDPCSVCLSGGGECLECLECEPINAALWPEGFLSSPEGDAANAAKIRRLSNRAFLNTLSTGVIAHNRSVLAAHLESTVRSPLEMNLTNEVPKTSQELESEANTKIDEMSTYYSPCRQFDRNDSAARRAHAECAAAAGTDTIRRIQCTLNACPGVPRVLVPIVLSISVEFTGGTHSNVLAFERDTRRVFRVEPMHPCIFQCWDKLYIYIISQLNAQTPSEEPWVYSSTITRGEDPDRSIIFQNPRADTCAGWGMYLYMLLLFNPDTPAADLAAHVHAKAPRGRWTDESTSPVFRKWTASVHIGLRHFMRFVREIVYGARFEWREFYERGEFSKYLAVEAIAEGRAPMPSQIKHHLDSFTPAGSPSYRTADWLDLESIKGYGSHKTFTPNFFGLQWTTAPPVDLSC